MWGREPKIGGKGRCGGCKIEVDKSKTIPNVQSCTNLKTAQKSGARKRLERARKRAVAHKHPVRGRRRGAEVRDSESISPASKQ